MIEYTPMTVQLNSTVLARILWFQVGKQARSQLKLYSGPSCKTGFLEVPLRSPKANQLDKEGLTMGITSSQLISIST